MIFYFIIIKKSTPLTTPKDITAYKTGYNHISKLLFSRAVFFFYVNLTFDDGVHYVHGKAHGRSLFVVSVP